MKKSPLAWIVALAVLSLTAANYKKVPSPFLGSYDHFKKSDWNKNLYAYRNPDKKAVEYKSIIFDPVLVYQSEHSLYKQLTKEEIQQYGKIFQTMLKDAFKTEVQIVEQPGPDTLRARFALRGLKRGNYHLVDGGTKAITPDSRLAAVTLEMEGIDSLTGERIVALVQNIGQPELEKSDKVVGETLQTIFADWIALLKRAFIEERALTTIPK